ncbi:MAG: hypothetical protein EOO08_13985 [Chitinophagaceae bacterium]|nr:MAG: hypothetical protein EOO08_13985 [Chitinophagaceae bacterium]
MRPLNQLFAITFLAVALSACRRDTSDTNRTTANDSLYPTLITTSDSQYLSQAWYIVDYKKITNDDAANTLTISLDTIQNMYWKFYYDNQNRLIRAEQMDTLQQFHTWTIARAGNDITWTNETGWTMNARSTSLTNNQRAIRITETQQPGQESHRYQLLLNANDQVLTSIDSTFFNGNFFNQSVVTSFYNGSTRVLDSLTYQSWPNEKRLHYTRDSRPNEAIVRLIDRMRGSDLKWFPVRWATRVGFAGQYPKRFFFPAILCNGWEYYQDDRTYFFGGTPGDVQTNFDSDNRLTQIHTRTSWPDVRIDFKY